MNEGVRLICTACGRRPWANDPAYRAFRPEGPAFPCWWSDCRGGTLVATDREFDDPDPYLRPRHYRWQDAYDGEV